MNAVSERSYTIRLAAESDADGIRRVLIETWHATYDDIMGNAEVDRMIAAHFGIESLVSRIRYCTKNSWVGVADCGGQIGGVAIAEVNIFGRLTVGALYVLADHQGRGVGTTLMNAIAAEFPKARSVFVEVLEANTQAVCFYERCGFKKLATISDPRRANVPIMGMAQPAWQHIGLSDTAKTYAANFLTWRMP